MTENLTSTEASESIDLFTNDDVSQPANTEAAQPSNEPTNTKESKTTSDNAPTSKAEVGKEAPKAKFESRADKRDKQIQASIAENKRILEEIRREKAQTVSHNETNQPPEPVFVEQPKKPRFTREQIAAEYQKASQAGDTQIMAAAQEALKDWDKYETDLKFWKIENGQKIEKFTSYRKYYWNQAVTKFPDLKNQDSPLYQEAKSLAAKFPEIINRPTADGEYLIAQLAAMRIERKNHASEMAALKEENKKLNDRLNATQKKIQPAIQGTSPKVSKAGEGSTAEERLAQRLELAGV